MNIIAVLSAPAYIILFIMWLYAENRKSKRARISICILAIVAIIPLVGIYTKLASDISNNLRFSEAIDAILEETITSIETKDDSLLARIKSLREKHRVTYEGNDMKKLIDEYSTSAISTE